MEPVSTASVLQCPVMLPSVRKAAMPHTVISTMLAIQCVLRRLVPGPSAVAAASLRSSTGVAWGVEPVRLNSSVVTVTPGQVVDATECGERAPRTPSCDAGWGPSYWLAPARCVAVKLYVTLSEQFCSCSDTPAVPPVEQAPAL